MIPTFLASILVATAAPAYDIPATGPAAPTAQAAPAPTPKPAEKPDQGGTFGLGVQFLGTGLLGVEGALRFGNFSPRLYLGWQPAMVFGDAEGFDAGEVLAALGARRYFNGQGQIYQHGIELLVGHSLFPLSGTGTSRSTVGALTYQGELFMGRKASFTFGGGLAYKGVGNSTYFEDRFPECGSSTITCEQLSGPGLYLAAGFRWYMG